MPGVQFSPSRTIAITGDTVQWKNTSSLYVHNVKAGTLFTSPELEGGESFAWTFGVPGFIDYICELHPGMRGHVAVYDIYLAPAAGSTLFGRTVTLSGLAKEGSTVTLQRVADDTPLGTTTAAADGRFSFAVPATGQSFAVRAVAGSTVSAPVAVSVRPKLEIKARKARRGHLVSVTASPAQAGATIAIERAGSFGWRRLTRGTLNASSKASLRVRVSGTARIRARVTRAVGGYAPGVSGTIRIRG
jgi:hypothetical protein